jgi:hypothetical protein
MRCGLALATCAWLAACVGGGDDQPPPRLGSIEPPRAAAGTAVILRGGEFCQAVHADSDDDEGHLPTEPCAPTGAGVRFGVTPALILGWNDEEIDVIVPDLPAGASTVVVEVAGRRSSTRAFEVLEPSR